MKTPTQTEVCETFWAKIYIAGSLEVAKQVCRKHCMDVGLCVTIEPTSYIYTGGEEAGVVVGLINYPRFRTTSIDLYTKAFELARKLREELCQTSFTVMTDKKTFWESYRNQ